MTALVSPEEWLRELRTRLPGISEGQLKLELSSTLREFFTKSGMWMEELAPINVIADKDLYKLVFPQAKVMGVHNVSIEGTPITLTDRMPSFTGSSTSTPRMAYMLEHDLLQLFPMPNVDIIKGLRVRARLNPGHGMCKVPVEAVSHFFDEIMDGVLGRLYSQPGKPYTNLIQSQYHLKRFRDGMAMARDMARRRYSTAASSWSFPQGWSTHGGRRGGGRLG